MNKISLKIITPNGIKFDNNIEILNTKTINGAIGINVNRIGLIAKLVNNISTVNIDGKTKIEFVILNGLLYSSKNEIKIFTDYCEEKSKINTDDLKKEISHLEEKTKSTTDNVELQTINFHIKQLNDILECFSSKN